MELAVDPSLAIKRGNATPRKRRKLMAERKQFEN
jgi:hypothetical protein